MLQECDFIQDTFTFRKTFAALTIQKYFTNKFKVENIFFNLLFF